ncbi:unnamed protein product [Adineta steineri]|uniref:Uncharacterized protein n=1 Tax=Adineta steineri TaxID=433720 RepID=A0A818L866_9BILA|nr:unnamed protein product [Adineta steineri]CAF3562372.1 unnamed protein product [Adineta steineri]
MPHKYRSHVHKLKRLHHNDNQLMTITNVPCNLLDENFFNKTIKYIKSFDYSIAQLIADHSTDPLQNTSRQYINGLSTISNEGRFINHEMIIRRNGETTYLRPKQDLVLANGFTPVIRPSSILPSYQSIMSHSQVSSSSSLSIMNKMSIMKQPEQTTIIKTKRKNRHRSKRCNEQFIDHHIQYKTSQESPIVHFFKQTLHEIIEEKNYLPPPLMSILPQFHSSPSNYNNQSCTSPVEDNYVNSNFNNQYFKPPLNTMSDNRYQESSYDIPFEPYHKLSYNFPQHEHICKKSLMPLHRNCTYTPGYFFD